MRKFLYILLAISYFVPRAMGQTFTPRTNGTFTPVDPYLSVPRALYIPKVCDTLTALNGGKDSVGALVIDTCNQKVWIRTRVGSTKVWLEFNSIISELHPVAWYNIKNAGADNTGNTDASSYITNAINAGYKHIYIPSGTYLISNTIQMKDSVTISGDDKSTIIKLTKNIPAFKCGWALGGNKTSFYNLSFLGTYPQDSIRQDGIFVDSCNGVYINNISAMKVAGWAIHLRRNGFCCGGYPLPTGVLGNIVSDCWVDSSYGGVMHDTLAEYNSTVNCTVIRGKYGFFTAAGSSRFADCNGSGTDYGLIITGGSNNAHGTIINSHFSHNRRMGLYVTGASNGYELIGCNIRQDSILIENSDNIRFTSCEFGASNNAFSIVNSTRTIFMFCRVWGTIPFGAISSGTTMISSDSATNGISIVDLPNAKRFDISQTNGLVDFTGTGFRRIRMGNDTLNFFNSGTHTIAGSETGSDSLQLTSTISASKGRIKFGTTSVFNEANGRWGIGTSSPSSTVHIEGTSLPELRIKETNINGHASIFFLTDNPLANGRILVGGSTSAFSPNGVIFSSLLGPIAIVAEGINSSIRFTKSTFINGSNEFARFQTNTGNFLYNTTTDNFTLGKFQIHSTSVFDSLMKLYNVVSPPSAYNVLVHNNTDSGVYQVPVSDIAGLVTTIYNGDGTLVGNRIVNTGGFTTTWTGSNDNETSFSVANTGTTTASAISGSATGTTSVGVTGTSTSYLGVYGSSTSNNGIQGESSSGTGVVGVSSTGAAFRGQINPSSNNTIEYARTVLRTSSSGAGANNIGVGDQYELETATNGNSQIAGSIAFKWTDATTATRTSQFSVAGVNSASTVTLMTIDGNGNATFGTTNAIVGTATNNSAVAGNVGEYVESNIASGSAVSLTTATSANVTSISLTAGDWDVEGIVNYSMTGATTANFSSGSNSTSATLGGENTFVYTPFAAAGLSDQLGEVIPVRRFSLSGTTTIYLIGNATFSVGSASAYGLIRARRVR